MPQIKLDNQPVTQITIVEPEADRLKRSIDYFLGLKLNRIIKTSHCRIAMNRVFSR